MTTIITRDVGASAKGSPLTNAEMDQNLLNLNTGKQEVLVSGSNIKTVNGATILGAGDLVISGAAINVSTTDYGQETSLPDATTVSVGSARTYRNNGDYSRRLKDAAGVVLGFIPARASVSITCESNSTLGGIWQCVGTRDMAVTASRNAAISFGGTGSVIVITLDADRQLLIGTGYNLSAYGVIYNRTTNTWGNEILLRASVAISLAIKSATNNVLFVSCNTTTGLEAVTLIASGESLSLGTVASATLAGNVTTASNIVQLASGLFVISYRRSTNIGGTRAISVSGTTPSIGAEDAAGGYTALQVFANTATTYTVISYTASLLYAKTNSVSGNAITAGTEVSTACTNANFRAMMMSTGRIAIMYLNTSTRGGFISISGTVPSFSTVAISSAVLAPFSADWVSVSGTKLFIATGLANTANYFNILTDTTGTASIGTELSYANASIATPVILDVSGNVVRAVFLQSTNTEMVIVKLDVSGASPTATSTTSTVSATSTPSQVLVSGAIGDSPSPVNMVSKGGIVRPSTNNLLASYRYTDRLEFVKETVNFAGGQNSSGHSRQEMWSASVLAASWTLNKIEVTL
jgi:hypothetical protein